MLDTPARSPERRSSSAIITGEVPVIRDTGPVPASRRRRPMGLRRRVTLFFSIVGLLSALALSALTYTVARRYLITQRTSNAEKLAEEHAANVAQSLRQGRRATDAINAVNTDRNGVAILVYRDREFSNRGTFFTLSQFPVGLVTLAGNGGDGRQIFSLDGRTYVAFGLNVAEFDASYFEAFPMDNEQRGLQVIASSLAVGAVVTALLAAIVGAWMARRVVRPLSRVADAASDLASGGLDTRLPEDADPDLGRLARSFNGMADAVQTRIQREARFASDVSHELRSPITALTAAVEVLDARRADMPDRSQQALDVVVNQVRRFDQLVLDLLELSRLDVGVGDLNTEEVVLPDLTARVARRYGFGNVPIDADDGADQPVPIDKRRYERVIANLLDNARQHAGGPVRIAITPSFELGHLEMLVAVEDAGPGIAISERTRIFERFARGTASRHRIGTGLGLALVLEHTERHGGRAWVEDRPGGGSRFMVSFPVGER